MNQQTLVEKLQLIPHIEGGYFREDFKSEVVLPGHVTGKGERSILTTCYYLLSKEDRSIFHRLTSDEIWIFISGGPVDFYEIDSKGRLMHTILGPDLDKGHQIKHLVKNGNWFGVLPKKSTEYALFSALVFPGFEFADWEKGEKEHLCSLCPKASEIIEQLT